MPITKSQNPIFLVIFFLILGIVLGNSLATEKFDDQKEEEIKKMFSDYLRDETQYDTTFSDEMIEQLNLFYNQTGENEFRVCLKGSIDGENISINNYSKFKEGDNDSVAWNSCQEELGMLHKHSCGTKWASYNDLYLFFKGYRLYNNTIQIIMFNFSSFHVFSEKEWLTGEFVV